MLKNKYGAPIHKSNPTNPQKPGNSTVQPPSMPVKAANQDVKKE